MGVPALCGYDGILYRDGSRRAVLDAFLRHLSRGAWPLQPFHSVCRTNLRGSGDGHLRCQLLYSPPVHGGSVKRLQSAGPPVRGPDYPDPPAPAGIDARVRGVLPAARHHEKRKPVPDGGTFRTDQKHFPDHPAMVSLSAALHDRVYAGHQPAPRVRYQRRGKRDPQPAVGCG